MMRRLPRSLALLLPVFAGACVDGTPLSPAIEKLPVVAMPALQCEVDVKAEALACTAPTAAEANRSIAANRMVGGQDVYVKLTSSGVTYDAGTETFQMDVTVQNLLQKPLGVDSAGATPGVKVFFYAGPNLSGAGSGDVTVANPTGQQFFTAAGQDYFLYDQVLQPYEISLAKQWQFNVPTTVDRFSFVVYVWAPQANETLPFLDRVWQGTVDNSWTNAGNWQDGLVPDSASAVSVPSDTIMAGPFMPALAADAQLTYLRVGTASSLDLGGYTLTAWGNVDAPGTITGGTLHLAGAGTLLRGSVPSVRVTGSTRLQGATQAAGAVSINGGSVTVDGANPLSISIP